MRGAKIRVIQEGKDILTTNLDGNGCTWVSGHKVGTPCVVEVEGYGAMVVYGGTDENESADDGELPDYDLGEDEDNEEGCGTIYSIPG